MNKAQLVVNPIDVANYLDEAFGVSKEQLVEIVDAGVSGRNDCTENHPASMAGTRCWGEATRALRELFLPLGWQKDNTDNIPSVVHKGRKVKIAVQNTDSGTGLKWGHPQPINDKGDGVKRAAFPNERGFQEMLESTLNATHPGNEGFWYLCIYCGEDEVRAELLCPVLNQADGSFKDFHKRVVLIGDGDDHSGVRVRRDVPAPGAGPAFEINVTRKQASA